MELRCAIFDTGQSFGQGVQNEPSGPATRSSPESAEAMRRSPPSAAASMVSSSMSFAGSELPVAAQLTPTSHRARLPAGGNARGVPRLISTMEQIKGFDLFRQRYMRNFRKSSMSFEMSTAARPDSVWPRSGTVSRRNADVQPGILRIARIRVAHLGSTALVHRCRATLAPKIGRRRGDGQRCRWKRAGIKDSVPALLICVGLYMANVSEGGGQRTGSLNVPVLFPRLKPYVSGRL
jgi:hypothetical protein